ncbi:hypothetical protein DPEC_G00302890 [Dallia pectoralis]|uniref:Uncharacterized protein n=1 Tax=Dallia pectoralis TaxID=75939 RepID=A0ACC2FH81_DALPE|nr:hypothetical protein DPEC_G00302890 [Dallia pectoralis]
MLMTESRKEETCSGHGDKRDKFLLMLLQFNWRSQIQNGGVESQAGEIYGGGSCPGCSENGWALERNPLLFLPPLHRPISPGRNVCD